MWIRDFIIDIENRLRTAKGKGFGGMGEKSEGIEKGQNRHSKLHVKYSLKNIVNNINISK